MVLSERLRLVIFGLFGSVFGIIAACVFLLFYYGTQYSQPVTDAMRASNAFQDTVLTIGTLVFVYLVVFYRKQIQNCITPKE